MSTAATPSTLQDPRALDSAGVSVVLASPPTGGLSGAAYLSSTINAAVPVWLHRLPDGKWIWINSTEWTGGTVNSRALGHFSGYTVRTGAFWHVLDPLTGVVTAVKGQSQTVPLDTPADSAVVTAGASRHPCYLYLLSSVVVKPGEPASVLQVFTVNPSGEVTAASEELIAPQVVGSSTVLFDKGIRYGPPYVTAFGTDEDNRVYCMRKIWSQAGIVSAPFSYVRSSQNFMEVYGGPVGWTYFNGTGYSSDASDLVPLTTSSKTSLTSLGPVGTASRSGKVLLVTVISDGDLRFAQPWISSASTRSWRECGSPIPLGSAGSNYLGAGLPVMSGLPPTPLLPAVKPGVAPSSALPVTTVLAVSSVQVKLGTSSGIVNIWDSINL